MDQQNSLQDASIPGQVMPEQQAFLPNQYAPMPAIPGQPLPTDAVQPLPGQPMPGQPIPMVGQPLPGQPIPMSGQPLPGQPMPGQPIPMGGQPLPGQPLPYSGAPLNPQQVVGIPSQGFPYQGMPAQGAGVAVFAPGRHHVSKAYLVIQMVGTILPLLLTFALIFISAGIPLGALMAMGEEMVGFFAIMIAGMAFVAVIAALSIGFTWLSWRNMEYQLTAKEFAMFSGIIFKKRMHVPYQKIQSVNQSASVFKRIFGLCDLEIDTAGGSDNTAIRIPCLKTVDAEILRTEIFRRKNVLLAGGSIDENGAVFMPDARFAASSQGVPQSAQHESNVLDATTGVWDVARDTRGDVVIDTGHVLYERGLSNLELAWASVTGSTTFLKAIIGFLAVGAVGLTQFIDVLLGSVFAEQFFVTTIDLTHMGASAIFGQFVLPILLALGGFLLLIWLASVLATVVTYGGFRVRRRETRIEVEHGLLRHVFQGLDVDRVQSVIVTQTLLRRIFGYCEVSLGKIDSITGDDSASVQMSTHGFIVHPCIKIDKVPELLAGIMPEYADQPQEFAKPPRVALRRAINRWGLLYSVTFWLCLIVAVLHVLVAQGVIDLVAITGDAFMAELIMGFIPLVYVLFGIVFITNVVQSFLWHRESGIAYNKRFMRIRTGGYTLTDVMFPRKKIQVGYTKTNPFQRHAGVKTVCARLASGTGQTMALLDVSEGDADAWLEWVRPHQNKGV